MSKTKKTVEVEERIRQKYQADDGIWLVQQGKVTEAKLLKEAYERIEKLKKIANYNANLYNNEVEKRVTPYKDENRSLRYDIAELKEELSQQKRINQSLVKKYETIKHAVAEIELLKEDI